MKRIEQNIRATTDVCERPDYPDAQDRLDAPRAWHFTVDGKERYASRIKDKCEVQREFYILHALRATKQATRMLRDFGFLVVSPGRRGKTKSKICVEGCKETLYTMFVKMRYVLI